MNQLANNRHSEAEEDNQAAPQSPKTWTWPSMSQADLCTASQSQNSYSSSFAFFFSYYCMFSKFLSFQHDIAHYYVIQCVTGLNRSTTEDKCAKINFCNGNGEGVSVKCGFLGDSWGFLNLSWVFLDESSEILESLESSIFKTQKNSQSLDHQITGHSPNSTLCWHVLQQQKKDKLLQSSNYYLHSFRFIITAFLFNFLIYQNIHGHRFGFLNGHLVWN